MTKHLEGFQDTRLELSQEQVDLRIKLGAITVAEKVLPEIFEGAYEQELDNLRTLTEERINE